MEQPLLYFIRHRTPVTFIFTHLLLSSLSRKLSLIVAISLFSTTGAFAQLSKTWETGPLTVAGQNSVVFVDQALDKDKNLLVLSLTGANTAERRAMLHKIDDAGKVLWSRIYAGETGSISEHPTGLWLDSNGNSYISGTSDMAGVVKSFLLRYSPDGALVWAKSFDSSPNEEKSIKSVTMGADNALYLSGYKREGEKLSLFTQKVSADGNAVWEKFFEPESTDIGLGSDISVDNKGSVYVTTDYRTYTADYSVTLIKYEAASGNLVYTKKFGDGNGPARELTDQLHIGPSGNIYLFTFKEQAYHLEPFMYTIAPNGGLIKKTSIGEGAYYRFSPIFDVRKIDFADDGGIIVLTTNAVYRDVPDYFLEKYKPDGTRLWLKTFNIYEKETNRYRQFATKSFSLLENGQIAVIGAYSYFVAPPAWYESPTYIENERLMICLVDQGGKELWREVNQSNNTNLNFGEGISSNKGSGAYVTGRVGNSGGFIFAMKYAPAVSIVPEAWVGQTHTYDKASKTITVNWKLNVSESLPSVAKYNVSHSSTENGQVQSHVWDMPAGKTSVEGAYAYPLSKIGSTENLVFSVAAGAGYKVPNTTARPSKVQVNVKEATGGIDPTITTKALSSNTLCAGAAVSVTFTATGDFGTGNTFAAQLSNASGSFASPVVIGSGPGSPISATIPAGTLAGAGYRIRVVASNPSTVGSDNGSNISISKEAAKPGAITGNASVCAGADNLVYTIEAVDGAKEYIWSAPGFEIKSGQGSRSITLKAGTASGKVSVVARGECGTSAASELAVTVTQMPAITVTTEGGSSVCQGGQVKLKAPVVNGYTYQWMKGGTAIAGATSATLSVNTTGSYAVKVTSIAGCTATSAAVDVKVNAPFEVNAGSNQAVCSNTAAFNLTGFSPSGGTWSGKGVSTSGSFNPSTAGVGTHELTYTVTRDNCTVASSKTITVSAAVGKPGAITGQSAVCAGTDNLTFSVAEVSGAAEYVWSAPGFEIKSGQGTRTITLKAGTASGKVSVVAKGGCGNSEPSEKQVTVNPVPTVSLAVFSQICGNAEPITLSGGLPEGGTYSGPGVSNGRFDPKAAGPGTHTITYTYSASGCGASATQAIVVKSDCSVTGIEDKEPKYKLAVYPNPADSHVKIELELERPSELTVRLVDMRGSVLQEQRLGNVRGEVRHSLDVSQRAKGLYLLQLITQDGVKTRRVVVQ